MVQKRWTDLNSGKPFFWHSKLPTGVYLKSERRPALLPSGHEVVEEIYFGVRLIPDVERETLSLHVFAFRIEPGAHTKRSVSREGYWYFDRGVASSPAASINVLKFLMEPLEKLALGQNAIMNYPDKALHHVVAWEERMVSAVGAPHTRLKEYQTKQKLLSTESAKPNG